MKKLISYILLLVFSLTLVGCGSTKLNQKIKSQQAIVETVANIVHQQEKAIAKTNLVAAMTYNKNIQSIVPLPTDTKTTNYEKVITQVINNKYEVDNSLSIELETTKAELKKYKGNFGLTAIKLGTIQLFKSVLYSAIGVSVLFLVLRIFCSSNPIVLAIFNFLSVPLAWVINQFSILLPNLLDKIKNTPHEVIDGWKSIFKKNEKPKTN